LEIVITDDSPQDISAILNAPVNQEVKKIKIEKNIPMNRTRIFLFNLKQSSTWLKKLTKTLLRREARA